MPTVAQIRAAIVAEMNAVTDIGRVHDYQRYAVNNADMAALYHVEIGGVQRLQGWFVSRTSTEETSDALGRYVVTHTWQVRGYRALNDEQATEKQWDDLIEALMVRFRTRETLGGVVASTVLEQGAGLQLDEHVPVMFAGTLCHMARLTLRTRHYE